MTRTTNSVGRRAPTAEVIKDNAMGMSLGEIAYRYGVRPSSIAQRLKQLGIQPSDTRRSFMDFVLSKLPTEVLDWVRLTVNDQYPIRSLVVDAIIALHREKTNDRPDPAVCPASLPEPES